MAVTSKLYSQSPLNMMGSGAAGGAAIDYVSDTIKVMLTTSANGISQTADAIKGDVTNEIVGTGYTAGGATLTSPTVGTTTLTTTMDAADTSWTTSTFTAAQAHVYDDTVATPVKPLILYVDFGGDQTVTAATFSIQWSSSGLWTVTVA